MMEKKRSVRRLDGSRSPFHTKPTTVRKGRRDKLFATTILEAAVTAGSCELLCNVPEGCVPGMLVVIGEGLDAEEERYIAGFASILVNQTLSHFHPIGTLITIYDLQG